MFLTNSVKKKITTGGKKMNIKKPRMPLILLISSILILTFTSIAYSGDYTSSDPNKNSFYNRSLAFDYANDWYDDYNTDEYYNAGVDCTNFVSQVLAEGGMPTTSITKYEDINGWRPHSGTWENAHYFRQYWGNVNNVGNNKAYSYKIFTKTSALADFNSNFYLPLYAGDVIQYGDTNGTTGHSQVIYDYDSYGNMRIAQHTSNGIYDLEDYITSTSYYYVFRYQIKNGA